MASPIRPLNRPAAGPLPGLLCAGLLLWVAGAAGCATGLVRRPAGLAPEARPAWESEPLRAPAAPDTSAIDGAEDRAAPRATATAPRPREERERVRRVNDYALWCVERELWDEARLHLERALAEDSLAASLHNNLAVVYERLGRQDRALAAYRRAQELRPKRAYAANLQLLEDRIRAADEPASPDSLELRHESLGAEPDTAATEPTEGD